MKILFVCFGLPRLRPTRLILAGTVLVFLGGTIDRAWAQVDLPVPAPASAPAPTATATEGLFFADVVVRGQPVFEIGGLSNLSARDRAAIINRRIASVLAQSQTGRTVTVQADPERAIATLQVNNRVLMTVTQQDAQDFNTSIEALAQQWADRLNQAFDQPPLAIDVGQRLFVTVREFQRDVIDNLPAFLGAFLVLIVTWILAATVRQLMLSGARHWEVDHNSKALVSRLGYGGVWVVGTIVALGVLGLDFTTLFGTLGLTSVAIGFSLRDVLSNYFSGVILLASRPFRIGDQIAIQDYEGTVTQIQLRATTIKTYDGRVVYIPNQEVFNASIVNNTISDTRRSAIDVHLSYRADISSARQVIQEAVMQVKGAIADPPPEILVWELTTEGVRVQVRVWVNSRRLPFLEASSQVAQAIKEGLQQANIPVVTESYAVQLSADAIAQRSMPPIDRPNSDTDVDRSPSDKTE